MFFKSLSLLLSAMITSSVMFTLRNKVVRTILFCSQCCWALQRKQRKTSKGNTRGEARKTASYKLGFSIYVSPGCLLYSLTHSYALNKHWLDVTDCGTEGERGKPIFLYNSFILFLFMSSKDKDSEV